MDLINTVSPLETPQGPLIPILAIGPEYEPAEGEDVRSTIAV